MRPQDLLDRLAAGYDYDPMYGALCNERDQLKAENAKLHELALTLAHCAAGHGCDMCPLNGKEGIVNALDMCDGIHDRMRQLGVVK